MAARFWRCILGLALALAAASGAWLSKVFYWPLSAALSIALGMLLAMPAAFVLVSFVIAQARRNDVRVRWSMREVWRALLSEIAEFSLAVLR